MTRRILHIAPAALAFLALVFVTDAAMAQCPSGSYSCGADYCTPDGEVCCANVGLPQYYCPQGTTCQSDGNCAQGASSSSVSSSSSSSSSSTSGGGGGECPSGSYSCGADYCTPDGEVCCANVGLPQYYCPQGTTCQSDGNCAQGASSSSVNSSSSSSSASSTSSGGGCPSDTYACGADYCTPLGEVCCADVGLPQYYCPSGSTCQSDGGCEAASTSGDDSSASGFASSSSDSTSSSPSGSTTTGGETTGDTSGSGTSGGDTSGSGTSGSPPPQIEGCSTYYDHGYDEYQVEVQCQSAYAYACAGHQEGINASCDILEGWGYGSLEACPYCMGTDPRENAGPPPSSKSKKSGGCAVSPSGSPAGETLFVLALLGFGGVSRRRSQRRAR